MTKSVLATFVHIALASEEDFALRDEGLSLLQTRVHKHEVDQGPEYFMEANGGECKPEEALTLAQCVEVQDKRLVPHAVASWSNLGSKRQAAGHTMPNGCSFAPGNQIEWSDQPVGTPRSGYRPICSKNGGRAAELAAQGSSCAEPTCTQDPPQLLWNDDGLYLPEIEVLGAGAVCEACGILTYAQCAKAADTGVLEAAGGVHEKRWPQIQCTGGGHSKPAVPSGCYLGANFAATAMPSFCPFDTPDGALAGWVSSSGVGVGWGLARPVCGSCTTTTTTPVPVAPVPEAETGNCPDNQMVAYVEGRADNAEYRRDAQRQMVKFDTEDGAQAVCNAEDDCVGIWSDGRSWLGLYPGGRSWAKGVPNGSVKSVKLKSCVDKPVEEDEAAAVGDPHFVTNTGNHFDYS